MSKYGTMLPALVLAGTIITFVAPEARAQTADNVDCNKCVEKNDLAKKAVVRSRIKKNAVNGRKVKDGSIELDDLSPAVQQVIAELQAQVAAMEALLAVVVVEDVGTDLNGDGIIEDIPVDLDGDGVPDAASEFLPTVRFEGVNVQVVNGDLSETTGSLNGLGNLIVGYNETRAFGGEVCSDGQFDNQTDCEVGGRVWALDHKSGSHNLVVGLGNAYSQSGGMVFGEHNAVNWKSAAVTGGRFNIAGGLGSSVSGGVFNTASGFDSSVSGGQNNTASGLVSSVSGGSQNTASEERSSVSGGASNTASGVIASISGGFFNTASGGASSVSGGRSNTASGLNSTVSGGAGITTAVDDDHQP